MVSKLMFMEIFEPEKSKVQKKKILSIKSEIVVFLHISAFRILTFSPALAESSAAQTFYCSLTASLLKFFWLVYVESKRMKTPIYSYSLEIVSFTYKNLFVIYTVNDDEKIVIKVCAVSINIYLIPINASEYMTI